MSLLLLYLKVSSQNSNSTTRTTRLNKKNWRKLESKHSHSIDIVIITWKKKIKANEIWEQSWSRKNKKKKILIKNSCLSLSAQHTSYLYMHARIFRLMMNFLDYILQAQCVLCVCVCIILDCCDFFFCCLLLADAVRMLSDTKFTVEYTRTHVLLKQGRKFLNIINR